MKTSDIYTKLNDSQSKVENAEQANDQSQEYASQYEHRAVMLWKIKCLIEWACDSSKPLFINNITYIYVRKIEILRRCTQRCKN